MSKYDDPRWIAAQMRRLSPQDPRRRQFAGHCVEAMLSGMDQEESGQPVAVEMDSSQFAFGPEDRGTSEADRVASSVRATVALLRQEDRKEMNAEMAKLRAEIAELRKESDNE